MLGVGLLLGRLSGYLRELSIAYSYKTTSTADLFILVLAIPDLINNLVSTGTMSNVFLPKIKSNHDYREVVTKGLSQALTLNLLLYVIVAGYCYVKFPFNVFILNCIALTSAFPNAVSSVLVIYLTHLEKFGFQSLGTLFFNLVLIGFIIFGANSYFFSFSILLAAIVRMYLYLLKSKKEGFEFDFFDFTIPQKLLGIKSLIFAIFANGLMFINPVIDKIVTVKLGNGSVAILSYAEKLYMLPVSVFLTSMAVVSYPQFIKHINQKESEYFEQLFLNIFVKCTALGLIVGGVYYFLGNYIVKIIYGIAFFESSEILSITRTLNGYVLALVLSGGIALVVNGLYAFKETKTIAILSSGALVLNYLLDDWVINEFGKVEYVSYVTSVVSLMFFVLGALRIKSLLKKRL